MGRAIVQVGADLIRIKERLPRGEFGKWLKAEFNMTERTAQNYMSAAELVGKYETVSVLKPKMLYLLAAPSTPEPTRQEILGRLNHGEAPSDQEILDAVEQAKHQQKEVQHRQTRGQKPGSYPKPASTPRLTNQREVSISGFCKLLEGQLQQTLDDLTRMLRDQRQRIAEIPQRKRINFAREYLRALSVSLEDLGAIVDGEAPSTDAEG